MVEFAAGQLLSSISSQLDARVKNTRTSIRCSSHPQPITRSRLRPARIRPCRPEGLCRRKSLPPMHHDYNRNPLLLQESLSRPHSFISLSSVTRSSHFLQNGQSKDLKAAVAIPIYRFPPHPSSTTPLFRDRDKFPGLFRVPSQRRAYPSSVDVYPGKLPTHTNVHRGSNLSPLTARLLASGCFHLYDIFDLGH